MCDLYLKEFQTNELGTKALAEELQRLSEEHDPDDKRIISDPYERARHLKLILIFALGAAVLFGGGIYILITEY